MFLMYTFTLQYNDKLLPPNHLFLKFQNIDQTCGLTPLDAQCFPIVQFVHDILQFSMHPLFKMGALLLTLPIPLLLGIFLQINCSSIVQSYSQLTYMESKDAIMCDLKKSIANSYINIMVFLLSQPFVVIYLFRVKMVKPKSKTFSQLEYLDVSSNTHLYSKMLTF